MCGGAYLMTFRSKMDREFKNLILYIVIGFGLIMICPLIFDASVTATEMFIGIIIFLSIIVLLLWVVIDIKYTFCPNYLLVKGGPFRSKIKYSDMTKLCTAKEIVTGYRLLLSKDALELFYKTASFGSVKISPKQKLAFVKELKRRCPHLVIELDDNLI